jgi:hypothetical protein
LDRNEVASFDQKDVLLIDLTNRLLTNFIALTENFEIIGCRNEVGEIIDFVN